MKRIELRVSDELYGRLSATAGAEGLSDQEWITKLIDANSLEASFIYEVLDRVGEKKGNPFLKGLSPGMTREIAGHIYKNILPVWFTSKFPSASVSEVKNSLLKSHPFIKWDDDNWMKGYLEEWYLLKI